MNPLEHIKILNHHAYFIHSFKDAAARLKEYLSEKFHIHHEQNPDFLHHTYEVLSIDDSRQLKEIHSSKAFAEGGKRVTIVECFSMTHEAQNALLKMFEEPNADSHFFIIMPSVQVLLPTLRSRLFIIEQKGESTFSDIKRFLKLSKKEKIDFVDGLAQKISDGDATKSDAQEFLSSLEAFFHEDGIEKNKNALKAILKARDYLNDRSASVKQLLEYVALSC